MVEHCYNIAEVGGSIPARAYQNNTVDGRGAVASRGFMSSHGPRRTCHSFGPVSMVTESRNTLKRNGFRVNLQVEFKEPGTRNECGWLRIINWHSRRNRPRDYEEFSALLRVWELTGIPTERARPDSTALVSDQLVGRTGTSG